MGASVAFHLADRGARNVAVLEQRSIGAGTTSQSSGILRTHYSVTENVELARGSWQVFNNFARYLGDEDAACGLVKCGYLICATEGERLEPLRASLDAQISMGIDVKILSRQEATTLLPIAQFNDAALIGFESEAGFADPYLATTGFARSARRLGVRFLQGTRVTGILWNGRRIVGLETTTGRINCGMLISTQGVWTVELASWIGARLPVIPERHTVLTLECEAGYSYEMPVFKDLGTSGMLYYRSYGGHQMLVSEGIAGETLKDINIDQADISLEEVADIGDQVTRRFPAYGSAGLASSWSGLYDVTPDWNPVLGPIADYEGLVVGFGFSGHGFKLSPTVGKLLAQCALKQPTDLSLEPYAIDRFDRGDLLRGKYGGGAVS
jgi:glycine/D-amino acid oxidase-like deaminating enzyme